MEIKIDEILSLEHTIAQEIFLCVDEIWQVIPNISTFILKLGELLSNKNYENIRGNIWISKNAKVSKTACLNGPLIIDDFAEIRHCAYIRGNVIIGKKSVVGNSTELKNSILFDEVKVPHYNYVGDSILGYKSHMGAGSIISNVKSNKGFISINYNSKKLETGLKKFGAIIGDYAEIGCNAVLNPGTIIYKNSNVYPLSSVRGVVPKNSIYKSAENIIEKKEILSLS